MGYRKPLLAIAALAAAACAVYPDERDTTQPDKIRKSSLVCANPDDAWETCRAQTPAEWYFRPTVVDAPYEAWWTFVGEQGDAYKITWEIGEKMLIAYRTTEVYKGSEGAPAQQPGFKGEPIGAWPISSHFDVWHQYNSSTGEELPVLYEATERPWYERDFVRVDWSKSLISGYGFFMGSKLTTELFGDVKSEPVAYAVTNPDDADYRILTNDYIDIVSRETHTPMTASGFDGKYFSSSPISQVSYRYSFMRAGVNDYQPVYYPDPAFEKFGFFRTEREVYTRDRGVTDMRDLVMNRWNVWQKTHSATACSTFSECGGKAEDGVTCDLFAPDAAGKGRCTLPYTQRGVKPIVYYLSPNFPARYLEQACLSIQGWNRAIKTAVAPILNKTYTPGKMNDDFATGCDLTSFKEPANPADFNPATDDIVLLKQNRKDCNSDGVVAEGGNRWCYRAGDLRFSMLYWVDQPSSGSPLGYGPVASDPATGQIIQGNAFIYGAAVDSYKSYIEDVYDLIQGNITEDQLRSGENVREYYQNLSGNAFPPTFPEDGFRTGDLEQLKGLKERLGKTKELAENLKKLGPAARSPFSDKLKGSWIERMLVDHEEWKLANGIDADHVLTDEEMDAISPFRPEYKERQQAFSRLDDVLSHSKNCVYRTNEYTDATVTSLAQRYAGMNLGRDEAINRLMGSVFRGVTEHELGHNMGLRHNFEGSFDSENFFEEYYDIENDADSKKPVPVSFSALNKLPLTPSEYEKFDSATRKARAKREGKGLKLYQYSSIMDYGGQFYSDFHGLGKYDIAAMKFGYANAVEVFDGAPNAKRDNRSNKTWYLGGENCTVNTECPFNGVGQICKPGKAPSTRKYCSNWDEDAAVGGNIAKYRFCSDERVADRPFCSRFDEGASSTEIVENLIDSYDRNYIFNNFRRYRRYFGPGYAGRIWDRYFATMGKQYASLLYQLYYNPTSTLKTGPGSFSDMLSASVKAMNFFERVLTTPDVGTYSKRPLEKVNPGDPQRYIYERTSTDCKDASGSDLKACLGVGKSFYSIWEKGYYGAIERQARAGTFTDKILAIQALTNRDWGNPQANDETYPLSFYDGFQGEMLGLFSGMISSDIKRYAPTIKVRQPTDPGYDPEHANEPYVSYRDVWSGSFYGTDATSYEYNEDPIVQYPGGAELDHRYDSSDLLDPEGRSPVIRFYALAFSLQSWPSIYDQNYTDYLQLYTFGSPEVHFPSGGDETVSYESPRRKKIFIAVQTPDKKSIIFPLVKQAADLKAIYDRYSGLTAVQLAAEYPLMQAKYPRACSTNASSTAEACRDRVVDDIGDELDDRESFLNLTYELRKQLGLTL